MSKGKNMAHVYPLHTPIKAEVNVPGSKSFTNRALILASIAKGTSTLHGCSNSNDSLILIKALQKLGVEIELSKNKIIVTGTGGKFKEFSGKINVDDAGTVMRFLTALCCFIPGEITLEGSERMSQRPIKGLVDALVQVGASINYTGEYGYPPISIKGGNLRGGKITIDASESSQFISALLMIAPMLNSDIEITSSNDIASAPYIDMTIAAMEYFGAAVSHQPGKYSVSKDSSYAPVNYIVEGDASSASYFFALAAITQSTVRVDSISASSLQGDIKFVNLLEQMGCKITKGENYVEVTGPEKLKNIYADMKNTQDVAQTLAVVAAFAEGTSVLTGLKNLEIKETKRLTASQIELTKMGIDCTTDGEQITIVGGNPKGASINTYGDHRMAMAFAIAGARVNGLQIESPEVVKKSFPDFWDALRIAGVKVDTEKNTRNIVLIGFMGSGKTTTGKLLAKALQLPLLETDDETVKRSGLKSINEIFEKKGEAFFRELEKDVILEYAQKSNFIISCGGGAIGNIESIEALKENGHVLFLSTSFETITERIKDQTTRPLFVDMEKAKELYLQRLPIYKSHADEIIQTENFTPEEVTQSIISKVQSHG